MIISELNYLEDATQEIVGGWCYSCPDVDFDKYLNSDTTTTITFDSTVDINDTFKKEATITVKSDVTGNSSSLAFDNEAIGYNSNTQGAFSQLVVAGIGSVRRCC
jgi:hypothetical protein